MNKDLTKTSSYDYYLPPEQIAQNPIEPRDHSRLLVMHRDTMTLAHKHFYDIIDYLNPGDLLVLNDTRVLPARVFATKINSSGDGANVEVFFLAPTFENGWVVCFNNSNFFLHLVNPLISIFTFLKYERTKELEFKHTFMGITTMLIYAVYYVINCIVHSEGNVVAKGYDWYGFFALGLRSGVIVLPVIILITYGISFFLWKFNR